MERKWSILTEKFIDIVLISETYFIIIKNFQFQVIVYFPQIILIKLLMQALRSLLNHHINIHHIPKLTKITSKQK
jgi:hypothetical protein